MEPDLSNFYHHTLSYGTYVALAYGLSLGGLVLLAGLILAKRRRLQKILKTFEA